MFPMGDGPFLAQRGPFITAAGGGAFVVGATAEATGTTEITFTLTTSLAYAGVEWGIDPALTWTAFDASQSTSHIIIIDGADGVVAATTYAWRSYATNDPLDAPGNRVYGAGGTVTTASAYDADAQAIIDEMISLGAAPTTARENAINDFVVSLKANSIWTELDRMYVLAASAPAAATIDWLNPGSNTLSPQSSPTFTADQGYTGNGSSAYLETNFALNGGVNYQQNDALIGVYLRTHSDDVASIGSSGQNIVMRIRSALGTVLRLNTTSGGTVGGAVSTGMVVMQRTGATATELFVNGSSAGTHAGASAALNTQTIRFLTDNLAGALFSTNQLSLGIIGGALTSGQQAALSAAFSAYLGAL